MKKIVFLVFSVIMLVGISAKSQDQRTVEEKRADDFIKYYGYDEADLLKDTLSLIEEPYQEDQDD